VFQQRTPLWIAVGGGWLTVIAGWVNAVGVLGAFHQALTHVTGTVTNSAIAFGDGDVDAGVRAGSLVVAFIVGATTAGVIIGTPEARRGSRYSLALVLEALLLVISFEFLMRGSIVGEHAAAAAAGLQNGLVTTWSGAVLRTSHVTGIATDLGLAVGHWLRRNPLPNRFLLHLSLLAGFFVGGVAGAVAWTHWSYGAMLGPVALCLVAAVAYGLSSAHTADPRSDASEPEQ